MAKLSYKTELPPLDEFQQALTEAMANSNPVDDLLALANDLWDFEQRYKMSSIDFYEQYHAGSLDDKLQHCLEWVSTYDFFIKTKRKLEIALMRAAVHPEVIEPAL